MRYLYILHFPVLETLAPSTVNSCVGQLTGTIIGSQSVECVVRRKVTPEDGIGSGRMMGGQVTLWGLSLLLSRVTALLSVTNVVHTATVPPAQNLQGTSVLIPRFELQPLPGQNDRTASPVNLECLRGSLRGSGRVFLWYPRKN